MKVVAKTSKIVTDCDHNISLCVPTCVSACGQFFQILSTIQVDGKFYDFDRVTCIGGDWFGSRCARPGMVREASAAEDLSQFLFVRKSGGNPFV